MPATELEDARAAATGAAAKDVYVRDMFSAIAPRYDLLNHWLSLNLDRSWRRRAIRALNIERAPAGCYLDLCAGTLDVAAMISHWPGFTGSVVGADFAEPMLRAGMGRPPGRAATGHRGEPKDTTGRVAPVAADALALPIADNTMAGAIVAFGIRNVANVDAALREAFRVLEPGARFVILEFTTPPNPVYRFGYHLYLHHVLPRLGRLVSGHASAYSYLPISVSSFAAPAVLAMQMQAAGFRDVHWGMMMLGSVALHRGVK